MHKVFQKNNVFPQKINIENSTHCKLRYIFFSVKKYGTQHCDLVNNAVSGWALAINNVVLKGLKALNKFGNCERPVFSLGVS